MHSWIGAAAVLAACSPSPVVPEPALVPPRAPAELGANAFAHVQTVVALGERYPGSPGWQRQLDYIVATLQGCGLPAEVDRWRDPIEGITFANVSARIPGQRRDRIVLGCHHDTKRCAGNADPEQNFTFVGANDGGSGVGLMLALAPILAATRREATLELVFFDGEESLEFKWNRARALFGSRHYVAKERAPGTGRHWSEPIRAMLLLDMIGSDDLQLDDDSNSDRGMKNILRAAARAGGHSRLALTESNTVTDDHLAFLDAGIPAAVLIDLRDNAQWHTPQDTLEHVRAESLQHVGEIVLAALPQLERQFVPGARR